VVNVASVCESLSTFCLSELNGIQVRVIDSHTMRCYLIKCTSKPTLFLITSPCYPFNNSDITVAVPIVVVVADARHAG
jgi:hypothetical protein